MTSVDDILFLTLLYFIFKLFYSYSIVKPHDAQIYGAEVYFLLGT